MSQKKLGILELLNRVGEDNIKLQNVLHSLTNIVQKKNGDVNVTFVTGSMFVTPNDIAHERPRNVGLLLWLPTELVDKAQAEWDAEKV